MILYINGCSHSRGACHLNPEYTHGYITAASLFGKYNFEVLTYDCIEPQPTMFSNSENIFDKMEENKHYVIFQPHYGKANDRIFFESSNFLYECIQRNIKIDYSIIQWSGPNRTTISIPTSDEDCRLQNVNAHDNPELGLKFEPWASATTIQYMTLLQDVYQKHGVSYVYIPYMELDTRVWERYPLTKNLDITRFTTNPIEGHRNDFRNRALVCDAHGHPSQLGSYILSSITLDILGFGDSLIGLYDYFGDRYYKGEYLNDPAIKDIKKVGDRLGDATTDILEKLFKHWI